MSFIPGARDLMQEAMDRKQKERENQYGNDVFRILADVADKATGGKVGGTPYVPPPYVTPPFAAPSAQSQANISAGPVQNPYLAASREMSATPGQLYPADFQQRVAANNMDDYNYNRNEMLRQRNAAEENYAAAQEMIKAGQANLEPRPSGGFVNDTLWGAFKNRLPYSTDPVTGQARIQTPQTAGDLAGLVFSKLGNTLANIGGQTEFHHGKGNNIYRLTFDRANADRMGQADRIRQVALDQTNPAMMQKRAMLKAAELDQLARGAVVVHVSRGKVLDEAALLAALASGRVGAAALDVFAAEPLPAGHPFWTHPRVLVCPHAAAVSPRFWERELELVLDNWARHREGRALRNRVDLVAGY